MRGLSFYSKDEATNFNADIGNNNNLNLLNIRLKFQETLKLMEIMEFLKVKQFLYH